MKQMKHAVVDLLLDVVEYFEHIINRIKRVPRLQPTLLAHNIEWFTYSGWIERLVAFKRVNDYTSR